MGAEAGWPGNASWAGGTKDSGSPEAQVLVPALPWASYCPSNFSPVPILAEESGTGRRWPGWPLALAALGAFLAV